MAKPQGGYCPMFGNYPKEYNRAVHGPYYPWVNYGPKDTPLQQVKLGELSDWLKRRNFKPSAGMAAFSRTYFLWQRDWFETKRNASKGMLQAMMFISFCSFIASWRQLRHERNHKYHW